MNEKKITRKKLRRRRNAEENRQKKTKQTEKRKKWWLQLRVFDYLRPERCWVYKSRARVSVSEEQRHNEYEQEKKRSEKTTEEREFGRSYFFFHSFPHFILFNCIFCVQFPCISCGEILCIQNATTTNNVIIWGQSVKMLKQHIYWLHSTLVLLMVSFPSWCVI